MSFVRRCSREACSNGRETAIEYSSRRKRILVATINAAILSVFFFIIRILVDGSNLFIFIYYRTSFAHNNYLSSRFNLIFKKSRQTARHVRQGTGVRIKTPLVTHESNAQFLIFLTFFFLYTTYIIQKQHDFGSL